MCTANETYSICEQYASIFLKQADVAEPVHSQVLLNDNCQFTSSTQKIMDDVNPSKAKCRHIVLTLDK